MKSIVVHGLLALAGMMFAYQTWTRDEEREPPPGEVTIVECEPSRFVSFSLENSQRKLLFKPKMLAGEKSYWFTIKTKQTKKVDSNNTASDNTTDKSGDVPTEPPTKPETFRANQKFSEFLEWLVPFRAVRSLGKNAKALNKEFEDEKEAMKIQLQCAGRKHTFEVGSSTYGIGNQYIRNTLTKEYFLIPGKVVRNLNSAKYRFMQKKLHNFELSDVDEALIKAGSKTLKLLHKNHSDPQNAIWVDANAPDRRNQLYSNWFSQVIKMTAQEYLPFGDQPGSELDTASGDAESLLSIQYFHEGKLLGELHMVRINTDKEHYYARTETTHCWVKTPSSIGKLVAQDISAVVDQKNKP